MQRILLRASWLIAMFVVGCMSPIVADENEPGGDDVVVVDDEKTSAGSTVSFSMDAEQFANIAKWLGHGNTLSIENPVHVEQDNVTLDAKAGTRFSYTMAEDSGSFTFEKPYPTVKAGIAKLIGGVSLHRVDISADGSGLASTGLGKYRFRWMDEDESGSAAASELPEVWAYSMANCPPCENAKKEIDAAKELPFRVVWQKGDPPAYLELRSRPAFWWGSETNKPNESKAGKTLQGWPGLKHLREQWQKSRQPKPTSSAISYHGSHDCPHCGREQYVIANDSGPNHTHRCDDCGTTWWHADAKR